MNSSSLPRFRSQPIQTLLLGIPTARAMEQEEMFAGVFGVKRFDPGSRLLQQVIVAGGMFFGSVGKIGQQREVEIVVPVGQESNFQRLHEFVDLPGVGDDRGDRHDRAVLRRDSRGKIHPRQDARTHQQHDRPIDERDCQLARAETNQNPQNHHFPMRQAVARRPPQGKQRHQRCRGGDTADIAGQWELPANSP